MKFRNLPDRHQETKNKHGDATSPTLLFIVRNFRGPKSSTHDISNTYNITMLAFCPNYDTFRIYGKSFTIPTAHHC